MRLFRNRLAQASIAVILCTTSVGLPAIAQSRSNVRQGLPGRRISGGTRGECVSDRPIEALGHSNNENKANREFTSLDFLLPKFQESHPVEFRLRDSQGNNVYTESLQTGETEEIVSIQIPRSTLKEDRDYLWYFSIICNTQDSSARITLSDYLQQSILSANEQLEETATEPLTTRHAAR